MESRLVLACEMMEHEIRAAMGRADLSCPVVWLERELHNDPKRLREALQEQIDQAQSEDVLLAFAQCGNAAVGLKAGRCRLVLPRFADCIHLLRSRTSGDPGEVDIRTLYLSPGFLEGRCGLFRDYDRCCARYGAKKARQICRMMVQHYRAVSMMDTGAVDAAEYAPRAQELSELLGLQYETCSGTFRVLTKLFSGEWDDEFVVIPPGGQVKGEAFWQTAPSAWLT